jgi:ABC-type Zn uptake system ZnuABC Zn-binding protein ZnuA
MRGVEQPQERPLAPLTLASSSADASFVTTPVTPGIHLPPLSVQQEPIVPAYDPHWWHDPRNAQAADAAIRDALTRSNPDAKDVYASNANAYLAKLHALDHAIAACVRRIPTNQRNLVTDHDAFSNFEAGVIDRPLPPHRFPRHCYVRLGCERLANRPSHAWVGRHPGV